MIKLQESSDVMCLLGGKQVPLSAAKPIGDLQWRERAVIRGRVKALRVQPWGDAPTLEATVADETGGLLLVFLGRRTVPGLNLGTKLIAEAMVGEHRNCFAMLNPAYQFLA